MICDLDQMADVKNNEQFYLQQSSSLGRRPSHTQIEEIGL